MIESMRALPSIARRTMLLVAACLAVALCAGCSAGTAEAPKEEAPVETAAAPFVPDPGLTFETPYYAIDLPEAWAGTAKFSYVHSYSMPNPGLGIGYEANVTSSDAALGSFGVACFTDAWGPQGAFNATKVGPLPQLEGNYLGVQSPLFDAEQNRLPDKTPEYASYVSIKEDPVAADGGQTLDMPYYSIDLSAPEAEGWRFTYDGSHRIEGDQGTGYVLEVTDKNTGERLFLVQCATEEFGPDEGDPLYVEAGAPTAWPQARVYVYQLPFGPDGGQKPDGKVAEYARLVTAR